MGDAQFWINAALGVCGAFGGWILNNLYSSMRDLQIADKNLIEKVQAIEVLVAGQYIPRPEFEGKIDALFHKLDKIEDKLDAKLDKSNGSR